MIRHNKCFRRSCRFPSAVPVIFLQVLTHLFQVGGVMLTLQYIVCRSSWWCTHFNLIIHLCHISYSGNDCIDDEWFSSSSTAHNSCLQWFVFFVVFEEFYYCVNCCYHNCLLLFGKIFQWVYGSIILFWYFNLSFPFVNIFIIVILFCDCLQVLFSFYCYLTIFQVIIDRPVFVLANINCYVIDAFIIQIVVSKMTVMYPSCQSFKCFFVKILFVNIRMVDTFLNSLSAMDSCDRPLKN